MIGLPMTTAAFNETILGHQSKSFDWWARNAKPHPWKKVLEASYALACEALNQIIDIGL